MLGLVFEVIIELKHGSLLLFKKIYNRLVGSLFVFIFEWDLLGFLNSIRLYLAYDLFEYIVFGFQGRATLFIIELL